MVQEQLNIQIDNSSSLDKERFYNFIKKNEPVVFNSIMKDWSAMEKWTPEFLKSTIGDKLFDVDMCTFNKFSDIKPMKFSEYIDRAVNDQWDDNNKSLLRSQKPYLRNAPVLDDFPELSGDVKNHSYFDNEVHNLIIRGAFIGSRDSITHLHKDTGDNLVSVVKGRKFIILISPSEEKNVTYDKNIEIASGPTDARGTQINEHPSFKNVSKIYTAVLNQGDSIFIPVGWLHYVHNLDFSISVSCWGKVASM